MVDDFFQGINPLLVFFIINLNLKVFCCSVQKKEIENLHCEVELMMYSAEVISNFSSSFKIRRTLQMKKTEEIYHIVPSVYITPNKHPLSCQNTHSNKKTS
jgi:hypothetical protein